MLSTFLFHLKCFLQMHLLVPAVHLHNSLMYGLLPLPIQSCSPILLRHQLYLPEHLHKVVSPHTEMVRLRILLSVSLLQNPYWSPEIPLSNMHDTLRCFHLHLPPYHWYPPSLYLRTLSGRFHPQALEFQMHQSHYFLTQRGQISSGWVALLLQMSMWAPSVWKYLHLLMPILSPDFRQSSSLLHKYLPNGFHGILPNL